MTPLLEESIRELASGQYYVPKELQAELLALFRTTLDEVGEEIKSSLQYSDLHVTTIDTKHVRDVVDQVISKAKGQHE